MNVSKYKILRSNLDKQIDIPIEIKWDLYGQDDDLDKFQEDVEVMADEIFGMYETSLKNDLKNIGVESEHLDKMYYYTLAVLFKETLNKLTSFE